MEAVKIYGLCIERLKYQIKVAKQRIRVEEYPAEIVLLESYNTGDLEDIVDILELYDLEERTTKALGEKLDGLAYTVSILTRESLSFGFTDKGDLGLYLTITDGRKAEGAYPVETVTALLGGREKRNIIEICGRDSDGL